MLVSYTFLIKSEKLKVNHNFFTSQLRTSFLCIHIGILAYLFQVAYKNTQYASKKQRLHRNKHYLFLKNGLKFRNSFLQFFSVLL